MLTLLLQSGFLSSQRFGPAPYFTLDHEFLRQGPSDTIIALHVDYSWEVESKYYSSLEIEGGPVFAVFGPPDQARPQLTLGPFAQVRLADGHAYGDGKHIAHLLESNRQWSQSGSQICWPCVEFRAGVDRSA